MGAGLLFIFDNAAGQYSILSSPRYIKLEQSTDKTGVDVIDIRHVFNAKLTYNSPKRLKYSFCVNHKEQISAMDRKDLNRVLSRYRIKNTY